ncbi:MAG: glycosyl hydrolase, partial [Treponema sp.]|nr:glycosyl hydrolase [Treponema sp.]
AYDIYYVSGNTTSVAAIKAGTRIQGVTSPYTITGLAGGQQYSVLVTALSAGYNSSDSTPRTGTPNLMNITTAPTLALTAGDGNIAYTITASIPAADNYVIYYRQGNYTTAADVKAGTAINNAVLGGSITGLTNSQMYSVIVTANLAGYNASDSAIRTATPVAPSLPASTVDRAYARGATAYSAAMSPHNGESFVRNPYDGLNTSVCQLDGGAGTKWFVVDLGAAGPIGTVRIVWGRGAGNSLDPILNYNIAVATTLANTNAATLSGTAGWMNVASSNKAAKNDAIDTDVITIPAGATGRYVRIMRQSGFTAANGEFTDWPRLAMLEVYEGGLPAAPWQRITTGSVNNVTAPARDGAPPTIGSSFTATGGFTATLTGISPAVTGAFAASTIYTYTFTLTPNQSYRFAQNGAGESQANISVGGTAATSATYHVSTTATNGTMTITREFPRTAPPEGVDQIFEAAPVLTLSSGNGSLGYSWTASNPVADNYTLYYRQGNFNAAQVISGGTAINNATSGGTISSLTNGQVYSVVVRANRTGYTSIESAVRTETPAVRRSNFKRGVGYNFVALRAPGNIPANQSNTHTEREMDLLMSGSNGISWFYSWGGTPSTGVEVPARTRGLEFVPTQWSGANTSSINSIRTFIQNNPGTKYVMGYNEPNFPNQANMTPTQAANNWPLLRALANETGAKLTTPKMNYGSMMNPIAWLDEFRTRIGEEAWSEIQAINVHIYPWWPSAVKNELTQANGYRKYGKPIWLTEFCGWEDIQGWRTPTPELQAWYMSMTVLYLEMDPMVERYAWYLPKGHVSSNVVGVPSEWGAANNPYHNLLTEQPTGTTPAPELTDLGLIYTNMTTLDKTVWVPAGQRIDAAQFTNCNMEPFIGINGWQDTVLFWPTNDTDRSAGVLEIYDLRGTRWVEYQVNLPATRNYTMTVRYRTIETRSVSGAPVNTPQAVNTSLRTTVNGTRVPVGGAAADTTLNSATWTTATVNLGNLTAGNHTIRLQTNSGNCAINWLQID